MSWSSTVHTALSTDTEPCIIVTFDNAKYIFNASENTGRMFRQSNRNWRKTKALFFTQATVERTSGLTGLVMIFADATIQKLSLYGPPGLTHIVASSRFYTFRDYLDLQTKEISWIASSSTTPQPFYIDNNVSVYAIPVLSYAGSPASRADTTLPAEEPVSTLQEKRKRGPSPDTPRKRLNPGSMAPGRIVLSDELTAEVRKKTIDPGSLSGHSADEFRRLVIKAMFPNTKSNPALDEEVKRANKKKSKQGVLKALGKAPSPSPDEENLDIDVEAETYRRPRGSLPNGFQKQLPKFSSCLPSFSTSPTLSYLLVGPRFRGKFDVEKAQELGVVGPDRGRLTKGETITIKVNVGEEEVERVVKPQDVLGEDEKPLALLILDIPSLAHISSLINSFRESDFYRKIWSEDGTSPPSVPDLELRAIYHLCGDGVLEDSRYKAFLNGFGPHVHHIVASKEHCPDPVTFTSAAHSQLRLNRLDEKMFPVPKHSLTAKKDLHLIPGLPSHIYPMAAGMRLNLRPFAPPVVEPEVAALDQFHPLASGTEPLVLSQVMQTRIFTAKKNVKKRLGRDGALPSVPGGQVGIIPLGTGGSSPAKYRNVLSTFIRIPDWGNILLDIGEGTWGQLARNFGLQKDGSYNAWDALRDLKCIFISHMHGDHHMGLAHLLAKRKSLNPPPCHPLYVVSVRAVHLYLRELSDVQDLGLFDTSGNGVISVISDSLHDRASGSYVTTGMWQVGGNEPWLDFRTSGENSRKMCQALGLEYFKTVDVFHRCRCYGCSFKHQDGWSITFSGDTMPTDNLVRIGMNSTVLIHEASMGDEEEEMARRKGHSTVSQAIAIGQKMNAKNILLTHFSARLLRFPHAVMKDMFEADPDAKHLIIPASDHANLTIGDMWKIPFYSPTLLSNHREDAPAEDAPRSRSASPVAGRSSVFDKKVAKA